MQIPILSGIYTDENSDFRTSYPFNLIPVPKTQGISNGYLRPAEGIAHLANVSGVDRGGINWNGDCFRVCGSRLVRVSSNGGVEEIGDVGTGGLVSMDYSFDRLAIASDGNLFYYNGSTLSQVTDEDLGVVKDAIWVDGYFMTTDGLSLVVTELSDPTQINPLKYGSSEVDPDPIQALKKIRNEVYAVNRYTVEVFDNVGGSGFPFQRIDGAQITKGAVGTHACCNYMDALAFIGGARNEPVSIWIGASGSVQKIATREIDQILSETSEEVLADMQLESRVLDGHQWLYVHLPDRTMVYDASASVAVGQPVWFELGTGLKTSRYTARNFVWCHDKWIVGHPSEHKIGTLSNSVASHWGETVGCGFGTSIVYNESNGALFHELELVALTGRTLLNDDPVIATQYSLDGRVWSQQGYAKAGKRGERDKRLIWLRQGNMRSWRVQRFKWTSDCMISPARLEARIEPLAF